MKVLIVTDLEGVSGIVDWDDCCFGSMKDQLQRELMTGEVNAAIAGAFDAGAARVKVAEGHDAIDITRLDERATLVPARWPAIPENQGWDEGFDAQFQIGKHAMSNTPNAVLAHTSNQDIDYMELNNRRIGEIGLEIAKAGEYGFPLVMISGDAAACNEAKALVPNVRTAIVKRGYGLHFADCLSPAAAQRLIHDRAVDALSHIGEFKPFVIEGPIEIIERKKTPHNYSPKVIEVLNSQDGMEVLDDRTMSFKGNTVNETFALRCKAAKICSSMKSS